MVGNEQTEILSLVDDAQEALFLLGLEGKVGDLVVPGYEIFQLRARRIARDLDAIVAYGASVLVIFLDLSTSNLEALAMIPSMKLELREICVS